MLCVVCRLSMVVAFCARCLESPLNFDIVSSDCFSAESCVSDVLDVEYGYVWKYC